MSTFVNITTGYPAPAHVKVELPMFNDALLGLLITTFVIAATHSISPDHWFGFVMLGRTGNWGLPKTLAVATVAGIGHVGTSVILSLIAIGAGAALAHTFASAAQEVTGWAMILFGAGYVLYAYRKGGHSHHEIPFINKLFHIDNRDAEALMAVHDPCDHNHDHHHYDDPDHHHDDDDHLHDHDHVHHHHGDPDHHHDYTEHVHGRKNGTKLEAGYGLVAIITLTPCILLMPLALRAGEMGMDAVVWTILVFFVATIATILILVAAGLKGLEVIRFEFFEKYGEVITGLVITFMGVMVAAGII